MGNSSQLYIFIVNGTVLTARDVMSLLTTRTLPRWSLCTEI
ncbi:MAG: hypothetical protein ACK5C0_06485 [Candidatus Kapaibacterium sp.]